MSSRLLTTTALSATVKCPKSHKSSVGEGLNKQTHVPVTGVEQKLLHMRGYRVLSTAVKEQHRRFIKRMLSKNKTTATTKNKTKILAQSLWEWPINTHLTYGSNHEEVHAQYYLDGWPRDLGWSQRKKEKRKKSQWGIWGNPVEDEEKGLQEPEE